MGQTIVNYSVFTEVEKAKFNDLKLLKIKYDIMRKELGIENESLKPLFAASEKGSGLRKELHKKQQEIIAKIREVDSKLLVVNTELNRLYEYPRLVAFIKAAKRRLSVSEWNSAWEEVEENLGKR